jgi:hypothetical protein
MTAKETYLISAPESDEFDPLDKAYRREQLQWLADRGLCSWSEAVEFFAGQLVPPAEYTRVTRNYAPVDSGDSPSAGQTNILSYRILYQDAAGLGGEVSWDGNSGPAEVSRDLGRFERCSHRLRKVNSVKRQDEHLLWTDIGPPCLFVW